MSIELQVLTDILDKIEKSVGISGKGDGRYKIYFLKNGNVVYIRYSNFRYTTNRPYGTYYFLVSIDKFKEYKERFRLILTCGTFENTLIIPSKDIENLFKNAGISSDNKWYFYINQKMMLDSIDLSKYLNKWELLNNEEIKEEEESMDKIRGAEIRSKIYEIISNLSRENKRCNHVYLCSSLYGKNFEKYEILSALKFLEEKNTIYKIIYVNWYIKEKYRDIELQEEDKLLIDIFTIIKNFSSKTNWQYGLKKSNLYDKLLEKGYTESDISQALITLEERKVIYKRSYIYWFTPEYNGIELKGDITDHKEEVIYMPDKIEENDLQKALEEEKIDDIKIDDIKIEGDNTKTEDGNKDIIEGIQRELEIKNDIIEESTKIEENPYSDVPFKTLVLVKKWKELKDEQEKMEDDIQKEIALQKELEYRLEQSIKKQNELEAKMLDINKEKDILEKLFEPIRLKYDEDNQQEVGEKKVLQLLE